MDRICEKMCSPKNKQAINRHEKNSHNTGDASEIMATATQLQYSSTINDCLKIIPQPHVDNAHSKSDGALARQEKQKTRAQT